MLLDVRDHRGTPCRILGFGHTVLDDRDRYDNRRLAVEGLSDLARIELRHDLDPQGLLTLDELLTAAEAKFLDATGISSRYIFSGSIAELGKMAAERCLVDAHVSSSEVDAILVGTNTSDSYSLASDIKLLINAPVNAFVSDIQAACPVGMTIVQLGWHLVRSGTYRRVLVIGVEKASTLASPHDYRAYNLFGDAAFAMLLTPGEREQFIFFDSGSDPFESKDQFIRKTDRGFVQNGRAVHKYVAQIMPVVLNNIFRELGLGPATVDHFFPHQPSARTVDVLLDNLRKTWPMFRATVHRNIKEMGNTSGACTGWMLSRAKAEGLLKPGQFCLVATFGGGMGWGCYGCRVP